jgi:hypothetical protein
MVDAHASPLLPLLLGEGDQGEIKQNGHGFAHDRFGEENRPRAGSVRGR